MNAEEVPSLLDENERLREELGEEMLESGQLTIERDAARSELAAARRVAQEAIEELEDMIGYVPDYFREKWDYDATIARLRAAVGGPGPTPEPAAGLCDHGRTGPHSYDMFRIPPRRCPGPTDDDQGGER